MDKITRIIKTSSILSFPFKVKNSLHHKKVNQVLNPLFEQVVKEEKQNYSKRKSNMSNIIWFFWWQGKNNLTPIGEKCLKSIEKNKGKRKIIFISKDNVDDFVKIPSYIKTKLSNNEISLTHFSDILRVKLLKEYGGLWLDSTIYVTGSLDVIPVNDIFTVGFFPNWDKKNKYISQCKWSVFCLGAPSNSELFCFLNDFYDLYWKKNDDQVDYYLTDYALRYAWENNISNFKKYTERYTNFAPDLYKLDEIINKKFNSKLWKQITEHSILFKLSNKKDLNEGNTFYFHL